MSLVQAIILGVFQGIAEFLPISSSGHLVLLQKLFKINEGTLFFTEMLHFGTLISIVFVYYTDIVEIIKEFFGLISDLIRKKKLLLDNQHRILGVMIIVGTIPTGLMGILFKDYFEKFYNSILVVSIALLITGVLLWIAEKTASGEKDAKDMSIRDALFIGVFQGFAITPGISRSGSTIVGGLFRGLDKKLATKFSFLLALPATLGASLMGIMDVLSSDSEIAFTMPLITGVVLSAITGVFAIKILIKILERGKLYYFSYYVWILGLILLIIKFS